MGARRKSARPDPDAEAARETLGDPHGRQRVATEAMIVVIGPDPLVPEARRPKLRDRRRDVAPLAIPRHGRRRRGHLILEHGVPADPASRPCERVGRQGDRAPPRDDIDLLPVEIGSCRPRQGGCLERLCHLVLGARAGHDRDRRDGAIRRIGADQADEARSRSDLEKGAMAGFDQRDDARSEAHRRASLPCKIVGIRVRSAAKSPPVRLETTGICGGRRAAPAAALRISGADGIIDVVWNARREASRWVRIPAWARRSAKSPIAPAGPATTT